MWNIKITFTDSVPLAYIYYLINVAHVKIHINKYIRLSYFTYGQKFLADLLN